ncbi:MAG TPA: Ig-like domain-containing protein [Kofleriaceae bacterium]|nr:Ig-like domain-containing protein [Kofleriaceae bacterium]
MRGIIVGSLVVWLVAPLVALTACGDNGGSDAPEVSGASLTTDEDVPIGHTIDARDPGGAALALQAETPKHGTVAVEGLRITYTPSANYNGDDSFAVTVDNGKSTATAQVEVRVNPVNDAPVAMADSFTTPEDMAITRPQAALVANDTDVDNDPLTVMSVGTGTNGTVTQSASDVTFTPAANFNGMASFQYTVTDGKATSTTTVTIAVTTDNDAPVAGNDTATTQEDTPVGVTAATLLMNDTDPEGLPLMVTAVSGATNGTVSLAGGVATFTPAANFNGAASFQYTVSDGTATAAGTVAVTVTAVNDAPVAVDDAATTAEDTLLTIAAATLVANDTDVDGDTLTVTAVGNAANGTVALAGGNVTFTPAANFSGTATFEYTVSDGTATDTGAVAVTVTPVNDAPVAVDDTTSTAEDTPLTVAVATLLANDTDAEGNTLAVTAVGNATNGAVVLVGGNVTFTPAANFSGAATFEYTVSDGTATDTGAVAVTVTPVNDAPVAVDDTASTAEDTPRTIAAATLVANDTDADGDTLAVTAVGNATNGAVALAGGNVTFTPAANFSGTATFEYTVSDGTATDTGAVTVTVTPVNDAPVAVDDTVVAIEDTPRVIAAATLVVNDTDADGDTLTVTAVGNATNGTVALAGGNVTFTPALNYIGPATFEYTVSDGTASDIGLVNVNVTSSNDAPVAVDDSATTPEDQPIQLTSAALVANDIDADGDPLTVTAVSGATNGTVVLAGGIATFTPAANFSGTAGFTYTVSDGFATDTGAVTITVTPVNDAPVATDDTATTDEDTPLVIAAATLLANDTDVEGDTLTVTAVSNATNGAAVLAGGNVTFTPNANFSGTASFSYTVSDGTAIDTGVVTITVTAVNDAPVAADDTGTTGVNAPLILTHAVLLGNDTDVDGPALAITAVQNAVNGAVVLGATTVTFTPSSAFVGTASFDYVVSDGTATDVGTVTITVTAGCGDGVVNAPEACDDGNTVETDGCTSQCVLGALCDTTALPGADRFAVDPATGHCYASFDDDQTTFAAAQAACVGVGGYLVTIGSAAEQALAHSVQNTAQNPWIGASEDGNTTDAVFDWVTDEPFTFTSFAAGQPDDDSGLGGGGDCLHMVDAAGAWNDTNCNITTFVVGHICEAEPAPCGDSVVQPSEGEECDDGNSTAGDGCSATCKKENIVVFSFATAAGNEVTFPADSLAPGLATIPVMSRGAGLTPSPAAGAFSSSGFTLNTTLDPTDFYAFTVTPAVGAMVSMFGITLDERRSGTGIRNWSVRSSLDSFAADISVFTVPNDTNPRTQQIPLGTAFRNLTAPVEFRFYGYASGASTGTWRLDNVKVNGLTVGP